MEGGTAVSSVGSIVALSVVFGLVLGTTGVLGAGTVTTTDDGTADGVLATLDSFEDAPSTTDAAADGPASNATAATAADDAAADDTADRREQVPAFPRRTTEQWDRLPTVDERDPGHVTVETDRSRVDTEHLERYVADAIGEYRSATGLEPWPYSYALASTARGHSFDMSDRAFFAHENPDGEQAWDRWGSGNCSAHFGENLAKTYLAHDARDAHGETQRYETARELGEATLELWKTSEPHDELLRSEWPDAAGVGAYVDEYEDGGYVVYVTLNVCASEAPEPAG